MTTRELDSSKNALLRNIALVLSLVILIASVAAIIIVKSKQSQEVIIDTPKVNDILAGTPITAEMLTLPTIEIGEEFSAEVLPAWQEWHDRNKDFVGWIKLGDTALNYPVVQYLEPEFDNNQYYLHKTIDREYSFAGTIFIDWHTPIVDKRRPDNMVIYGHNMNDGTKFATLVKYFAAQHGRDLSAYHKNPTIDFTTVYEDERSTYKIFAAMFVNSSEAHGEVFNYYRERFFDSKADFYDYVANVMDRSVFYTDVDLEYGDEIMTLSTCYYPLGNDTDRFVVLARRVREGESTDVDTSVAYINPSPLYFDYYYRVNGGSWAGRDWDTSKVKGFDEFYSQ